MREVAASACWLFASVLALEALADEQPSRLERWPRTREQGVVLARIAANEDSRVLRDWQPDCKRACGTSGAPTPDAHGIGLAVLANADTFRKAKGWLDVMGALAPHVSGKVPPNRERQASSLSLPARGKEMPRGWVEARDGSWGIVGGNWATFREAMVESWLAADFERVTVSSPITWGTEEDFQRNRVERRLCRLRCDGCANVFAGRLGDRGCVSEMVAGGSSAVLPASVAGGQ